MSAITLALRQVRYENKAFWRNPASAFFTFVFPLMFLVIFNSLFGSNDFETEGGTATVSTFYVPGIMVFAIVTACYTNIAMGVTAAREQGLLKRTRGTPLPTWSFLFGRIVHAVFLALILVVIITVAGSTLYDVDVPSNTMPAFIVSVAVGAAVFASLGLAITCVIPNADASPAIVNASIFPLLFLSNVFIPMSAAPDWLNRLADIFPVKHFSTTLLTSFNPFEKGAGFEPLSLLAMAAWGIAGLAVAIRYFSWEPRR